jgi:peroxiredoxin
VVLAASTDPGDTQRAFASVLKTGFPYLPDTGRNLSVLYHAAKSVHDRCARQTVLIDRDGRVRCIDSDVHVATHGKDILERMRQLGMIYY